MIEFIERIPTPADYGVLFETTGWNEIYHASPEDLIRAASNSWCVLSAYDGSRLVGFGRVLTDQVLHAMIYELIVHPDYQNQGIGGGILERLVSRCREAGIHDIQLFCARGKRPFYEKRGFLARPNDAPGMYYGPPLPEGF